MLGISSGAQTRDATAGQRSWRKRQDPDGQKMLGLREHSVTGPLSRPSRGSVMMSTLSRKCGAPQRSWSGFCSCRKKLWPDGSWSGPQRQRGPAG